MGVIPSWVRIPPSPPPPEQPLAPSQALLGRALCHGNVAHRGEVLEWPNRRDWKSRVVSKGRPWVRIPPSPPQPARARTTPVRQAPPFKYDPCARIERTYGFIRAKILDRVQQGVGRWPGQDGPAGRPFRFPSPCVGGQLCRDGRGRPDRRTARRIATRKEAIDPAAELGKVEAAGVRVLTWHDADYPARLGEI